MKPDAKRSNHATAAGRKSYVYPDLVFNGLVLAYLLLGVLLTLAIMKPFGLGQMADPLNAPKVVKPEWYFLAFYQFINYLPKGIGSGFVFSGLFLLCIWPFLAGLIPAGMRRRLLPVLGILFVFFYLSLTAVGYLAETERTLFGRKYRFDSKGIPHGVTAPAPAGRHGGTGGAKEGGSR